MTKQTSKKLELGSLPRTSIFIPEPKKYTLPEVIVEKPTKNVVTSMKDWLSDAQHTVSTASAKGIECTVDAIIGIPLIFGIGRNKHGMPRKCDDERRTRALKLIAALAAVGLAFAGVNFAKKSIAKRSAQGNEPTPAALINEGR